MVAKVNLELVARDAIQAVRRKDLIVVIDVLRCTSSILNAFANGADKVIPTKTLDQAYRLHREHPGSLLAGERRGVRPRGFDLGNSPLEFTQERVYDKTLIFTTTSGTAALTVSSKADRVLIGAFLNTDSVARKAIEIAEREDIDISLVLSGRKGQFSLEDFLCGGAIAERLQERRANLSDSALAAVLAFKRAEGNLHRNVMMGEHAKHLIDLGFKADVAFSCQLNLFEIVPVCREGVIGVLG